MHFVTGREMVNIILAACDVLDGNAGQYRDYRLRLITPVRAAWPAPVWTIGKCNSEFRLLTFEG